MMELYEHDSYVLLLIRIAINTRVNECDKICQFATSLSEITFEIRNVMYLKSRYVEALHR